MSPGPYICIIYDLIVSWAEHKCCLSFSICKAFLCMCKIYDITACEGYYIGDFNRQQDCEMRKRGMSALVIRHSTIHFPTISLVTNSRKFDIGNTLVYLHPHSMIGVSMMPYVRQWFGSTATAVWRGWMHTWHYFMYVWLFTRIPCNLFATDNHTNEMK